MTEPPEFWAFLFSNVLLLAMGGTLTALSFAAYRRSGTSSFRLAGVGFLVLTVGTLVEAIYELGIRGSYELSGRELLALHTVESLLIAAGLGLVFWSLKRHR